VVDTTVVDKGDTRLDAYEGDVPRWGEDAFVVAPCSGRVDIDLEAAQPGAIVYSGAVIGHVMQRRSSVAIVSRFTGMVQRHLVEPGSKVRPSQPVLWLRKL
jgi:hypothetical protein